MRTLHSALGQPGWRGGTRKHLQIYSDLTNVVHDKKFATVLFSAVRGYWLWADGDGWLSFRTTWLGLTSLRYNQHVLVNPNWTLLLPKRFCDGCFALQLRPALLTRDGQERSGSKNNLLKLRAFHCELVFLLEKLQAKSGTKLPAATAAGSSLFGSFNLDS